MNFAVLLSIVNIVLATPTTHFPTTLHPTKLPTPEPTHKPTTQRPTHQPTTAHPTKLPTPEPTHKPTTAAPTHKPTTAHPTKSPTPEPTHKPTTAKPTHQPTTVHPTKGPTTHRPTTAHPTSTKIFAVSHLFLGTTNVFSVPDSSAWAQYGRNIDGFNTQSLDFSQLCLNYGNGWQPNNYVDGPDGVDNAFGKVLLPIIQERVATYLEGNHNNLIAQGRTTMIFQVSNVGAATHGNFLITAYRGAQKGTPPLFDGSDVWPVDGPTNVSMPNSPLVSNTLTGTPTDPITVRVFDTPDKPLDLTIYKVKLILQMDPTRTVATGMISGVINMTEFLGAYQDFMGRENGGVCPDFVLRLARTQEAISAGDMMYDGTQDPSSSCDGVSIGLAFNASIVELGGFNAAEVFLKPCTG